MEKVELSVIVSPKDAREFHEELEKTLVQSNCSKGECIMSFSGEPNEEGFRAEVNMYASLEDDETPWTELVVYDKEDKEVFNSVEDFGIADKFEYEKMDKLDGRDLVVKTCFAYSKNVYQFAIEIVNSEGFFVQNNMNGSFYLMSKEFISTTMDGHLFDNLKELLDALKSYHKKYIYSTKWYDAIDFLESKEVSKILEELTPKEVSDKQYAFEFDENFSSTPNYTKYTKLHREWQKVYQIADQYGKVNEVASLLNFLSSSMSEIKEKVEQEAQNRQIKDWEIVDPPERV